MVVENQVRVIGQMDNTMDNTFESANRVYDIDGIAPAMNTCGGGGLQPKIFETISRYRIRKLTPLECWRLMDFADSDFHKAEEVNSNSQLYKEAGNSIVKVVLMAIMSQLNIKGVTPWNELSIEERSGLSGKIKATTTDTEDETNGIY